jgi:hypothetical protein
MSVNLRTVLLAEAHAAEGQWLQEQLPRLFRVGTRTPQHILKASDGPRHS